jgi:hypothetical protein
MSRFILVSCAVVAGCSTAPGDSAHQQSLEGDDAGTGSCGDMICEAHETYECPSDCGYTGGDDAGVPSCGNAICEADETSTCPSDCGIIGDDAGINDASTASCGDGACDAPETQTSCPADCGSPNIDDWTAPFGSIWVEDNSDGSCGGTGPDPEITPDTFVAQQAVQRRCDAGSVWVPPLPLVWPIVAYCNLEGDLICNTANVCTYNYTNPPRCGGGSCEGSSQSRLTRFTQTLSLRGSPIGGNVVARFAACSMLLPAAAIAACGAHFGFLTGPDICETRRPRVDTTCP